MDMSMLLILNYGAKIFVVCDAGGWCDQNYLVIHLFSLYYCISFQSKITKNQN